MRLILRCFLSVLFVLIFGACDKDEDRKCISCPNLDTVEICDAGDGNVTLVVEGNVVESTTLSEGATLEDLVEATCAQLRIEKCYECSNASGTADICEENGEFTIDGQVISNPNDLTLEELVALVESNPNNDPELENLECTLKP